ncbi:hypothetical protein FQN54_006580 [Arachnomyces sp. PD_36]|nr:hypothetical protein FQN54_006580 [Arachnomyces sp. PD_36]
MEGYRPLTLLASFGWLSLSQAILDAPFGQHVARCPSKCSPLDPAQSDWSQFHHLEELEQCDQPFLFTLNVQNLIDDPDTVITIQACSQVSEDYSSESNTAENAVLISDNCGAATQSVKAKAQIGSDGATSRSSLSVSDISLAASHLATYLNSGASCGTTAMFAKAGDAVVGLYSGAEVQKTSAAALIEKFQDQVQKGTRMIQVCEEDVTAAQTLGIFAGSMGDIGSVQDAVKTWTNSQCLSGDGSTSVDDVDMNILVSSVESDSTADTENISRDLDSRAKECRDIKVKSGDSCGALASRCGITGAQFTKFNPGKNFCASLMPGQYVCCSAGELPDHRPKPGADGSCYAYTVQPTDGNCWNIATSFGIEVSVIENNNKNTWGWSGCDLLQIGQRICLSEGKRPFPNSIKTAICGPQVPGTEKPTDGTLWAQLNPCPLNACCDIWGSCGATEEYCTPSSADTGNPGTAQPGANGCISNCGTDIVNNDEAPATFRRVGYFEAWNGDRPCLNMNVSEIDTSELTHLHFAFATVTEDFQVSVDEVQDQFNDFIKLDTDVKKILSFGGWGYSTGSDIFREATNPQNREAFATSAIAVLEEYGLDGLDFDWEDIGGSDNSGDSTAGEEDAVNYLKFLGVVKSMMPEGASLSVALPASYWYLQHYRVKSMQELVDYFAYMTYDFHGQWDYGSQYAISGCPAGNCVRSHVNITETKTSLSMITKAGVKASKLLVGITSYGRSFRMSDSSCRGPMCTYTGTNSVSNAYLGRCTETAGYLSNAEIQDIINKPEDYPIIDASYDPSSDSDILVYGTEEKADWVGYMGTLTKESRVNWIKGLNFGGATDWAVDLIEFVDEE